MGLTGVEARCLQGCVPFYSSREHPFAHSGHSLNLVPSSCKTKDPISHMHVHIVQAGYLHVVMPPSCYTGSKPFQTLYIAPKLLYFHFPGLRICRIRLMATENLRIISPL